MKKIILILIIPLILSGCTLLPAGGRGGVAGPKGVFQTADQGLNWVEQNKLADSEKTLSRLDTYGLAFDIFDTNILYRSTNTGLFVSGNAGQDWQRIYAGHINDFALNPKTRSIIYVASGNQVYKTTDSGQNWQAVYTEARPGITIPSLAISHFDTSQIFILASDGVLMQSIDWGSSWQSLYNFKQPATKLLIDPNNSQVMFAAGSNHLYRSTDSGETWTEIMADQFKELKFIKNNLAYLSNKGIFISSDYGDNWQPISLITPIQVDISTFAINPKNTDEIYYLVGNVLYRTVDNGYNWKTNVAPVPGGARASQLLINPEDTNIIYLSIRQ